MSEPVSGLLTVKPDNASHITEGSIHNLVIEKRTSQQGKEWIKLKRDRDNGSPYRLLSARQTDWVDPKHGNISFSLLVEPVEGNVIAPSNNGGGGEFQREASPATQARYNRNAAFTAAAEIAAARVQAGSLQPEDVTGYVGTLTAALLPVIAGEATEAVVGAADPKAAPPMDTAESVQADATAADDIPF